MKHFISRLKHHFIHNVDKRSPSSHLKTLPSELPLPYSWILTNRLAIGPMPRSDLHWLQLDDAGLRSRFSCCYQHELEFAPCPTHWQSMRIPLPDHRRQEPLTLERLESALNAAESLLTQSPPLYVHCMAGIERSPLIAVGLTARSRKLSIFDALDWVRRCHPASLPIFSQLEILDQILSA